MYPIFVFSVLGDIVRAPIDGREALYALWRDEKFKNTFK